MIKSLQANWQMSAIISCPKCGVASDFHVNMYCRKIQGLTKGISRLKQQLAEANNKLKNEHHD
jgi:hypothetical protein